MSEEVNVAEEKGQEQAQSSKKYLEEFLKTLEKDPESLTGFERKLGERYLISKRRSREMTERLAALEREMAETKVNRDGELGKAAGILEALIAARDEVQ